MKKIVIILLCVSFVLGGCTKNNIQYPADNIYHFETDSQYTFYTQAGFRQFAESEDGYYFTMNVTGSSYIFYADKKTMKPVPLCEKPNCLHYKEEEEEKINLCSSRIQGLGYEATIFYSNGKLYALQNYSSSQKYEFVCSRKKIHFLCLI